MYVGYVSFEVVSWISSSNNIRMAIQLETMKEEYLKWTIVGYVPYLDSYQCLDWMQHHARLVEITSL